jgi:hypothetical protein
MFDVVTLVTAGAVVLDIVVTQVAALAAPARGQFSSGETAKKAQ